MATLAYTATWYRGGGFEWGIRNAEFGMRNFRSPTQVSVPVPVPVSVSVPVPDSISETAKERAAHLQPFPKQRPRPDQQSLE
jgi:hypothetical protein